MTYLFLLIFSLLYEIVFYAIFSFAGEKEKYLLPVICSAMIGTGLINTDETCVMIFILSMQCICICVAFPIMIKYDETKSSSAFMIYSLLCSMLFIVLIGGNKGYLEKNNIFFMAVIILLTLFNSAENRIKAPKFKDINKVKLSVTAIIFVLLTVIELLLARMNKQILNGGFANKRFTAVYLSVIIIAPVITYAAKNKNRLFCGFYFINCPIYITAFTLAVCLAASKNNHIRLSSEICSIDIPFILSAATLALLPIILKTKITAARKLLLISGFVCYTILSVRYLN